MTRRVDIQPSDPHSAFTIAQCKWEDCGKAGPDDGRFYMFPDGSTYCMGECTKKRFAFLREVRSAQYRRR